ncbi:hypothetical protein SCOCK_360060 [Actinacidiphila cocklensis]|uniref:Uncharacterized protein n=1 Tax=Actinacidiphila cocklensis TaxID=887465 RepID=A0A9W4E8V9_9ACTN|nr:hypothetical protein SCOCK_360060 [Actinacidiphila cocklensis]
MLPTVRARALTMGDRTGSLTVPETPADRFAHGCDRPPSGRHQGADRDSVAANQSNHCVPPWR